MVCQEVPYTISDCSTPEELVAKNFDFMKDNAVSNPDCQYMKSLVARCPRDTQFYPVYANAAKYGPWAADYGATLGKDSLKSILSALSDIFKDFNDTYVVHPGEVTFGDLTLLVKSGSSLDQAIAAYGVMRNVKIGGKHTPPQTLRILIDKNNDGYLGVDIEGQGWTYLDFSKDKLTTSCPHSIEYSFNEVEGGPDWADEPDDEVGSSEDLSSAIIPLAIIVMVLVAIVIVYRYRNLRTEKRIEGKKS
jgi:hypothetical protein